MPKMKRPIGGTGWQVLDMAGQLELDQPRLFARNRRIIIGAIAVYVAGVAVIAYVVYRVAEAVL